MFKFLSNINQIFILIFLFLVSFLGLSFAMFSQYVLGLEPCYLCIYQRIGLFFVLIVSLLSLILIKLKFDGKFQKIITYLMLVVSLLISLVSSIKLVYLQMFPPDIFSCSMGSEALIDNFGWVESLPILFNGSGDCSTSSGSFLFLTFEQWSLTFFLSIFILFSIFIFSKIFKKK